jgi:hypothetical protein
MKREIEIDAARGLMLVWMTLTHLPTAITPWVNQPFGYFSASDGFIFLSALFTGRIYYCLLQRSGARKMTAKLLLRSLYLYGYHAALLFFAFVIAARYAIGAHSQGLFNLLDYYFAAGPAHAILSALLLIYRPPLLDIIPLYIIFLLLSPAVILLAARTSWKPVLAGSVTVWFLAQFGLREAAYAFLAHHAGLRIPLNEMGAFNLWAWQLLWILGMWCGVRWTKDELPTEKWGTKTWVPATIVVAGLIALRYAQIFGFNLGRSIVFVDKWHLGVARLIDFAAASMLLIRFRPLVKRFAIRPLVLLGQSSLQVFSAHFLFCFVGIAMMGNAERIFGWGQVALIAVTFAALLLVANLNAKPELFPGTGAGHEKPAAVSARSQSPNQQRFRAVINRRASPASNSD